MSLYDSNNARLLLGALLSNPSLLYSEKINLTKDDFEPQIFHQRLYQAIVALSKRGAKNISAMDIYNLCKNNSAVKTIFDDNSLTDFVDVVKSLADLENVDLYYEAVRKCSILRAYANAGFSIDKFSDDLSKFTIDDIVDYFDGQNVAIKKKFYQDKSTSEIKAGDGFRAIKEQFKADPLYGATSFNRHLNTAARGWRKGQLTLYGCVSGSGKTTLGLYNLALVCCNKMWDEEAGDFVDNPCYQHEGGLFIQYELNAQEELTPKLVASISGVQTYHILNGKYEEGEEERVDKAIDILEESNIHIVTMPSFTNDKLKSCIRDYKLNHQVGYVVFDYVSQQSAVASDIAKKNGVSTRSDQVLADIVANLKEIAIENNVAILTFSQTNANVNNQEILDAGCLAGSRAMQDKLDVGGIIMPLRKKEREICSMMMEGQFSGSKIEPNRIIHLFKVRFGNEAQNVKIWFHLDLNTGRCTEMWCTDAYDKPYTMTKTKLVYND